MATTEHSDKPSFADRMRQQFTDAAVVEAQRLRDLHRSIGEVLKLRHRERVGEIVELAPGIVIAEVEGGPFGTIWRFVADGKPNFEGYYSRWAAILAAAGHVHDAGGAAWSFAARVLQVHTEEQAR